MEPQEVGPFRRAAVRAKWFAAAFAILDRQAEEIVSMAVSAITRLNLGDTDLPVVLGGGVLATANRRLLVGITVGLERLSPRARVDLVRARPILGAAMLALESAGADRNAIARAQVAVAEHFSPASAE